MNIPMIALYRGSTSLGARAIRWRTRMPYHHAAWLYTDGRCFEAIGSDVPYCGGRVVISPSVFAAHHPGIMVDLFYIPGMTSRDADIVLQRALSQVDKPYDWPGVLGFITGRGETQAEAQRAWFCSEYVHWIHLAVISLLNCESWLVSPGLLKASPHLVYSETLVCGRDEGYFYNECNHRGGKFAYA